MEKEDHIDRALVFMENLEKLGEQLRNAQQQLILTMEHMLAIEQNHQTDTDEYREQERHCRNLHAIVDKWQPVYEEKMEMLKEVKRAAGK